MRTVTSFILVTAIAAVAAADGTHHHLVDSRGDNVMGFSHDKTNHHFLLFKDGGAIQVTVKSASDKEDLSAIRSHLQVVAKSFAAGDMSMPMMVHNTSIPGLSAMKQLHGKITYHYAELPRGARVRISTTDPAALRAVHSFLGLQVTDHRTGDSGKVVDAESCPLMGTAKCPMTGK
jgi:hypothetical protein